MLMVGGVMSVIGGLVVFAWAIRVSTESLASDPFTPRLGVRGVRLLHMTAGLFGVALGVLALVSRISS